ncbi:MAG TPA: hypothetical protein VMR75_03410 [Candidatus Saccharimonadales bacterium]|nr:hypothetical protein [Candidatus Saccharimonadales bacterium]
MTRIRVIAVLAALVAVMGIAVASASADSFNPQHQSHMGACARETENIATGVSDLAANGVATKFAAHFGINAIDGNNVVKRLETKLVVGEAVKAVTMQDTGCNGHGGNFKWTTRTVEVGEKVVVNPPPSVGKEACKHPYEAGCVAITIRVETLLPISCWNRLYKIHVVAVIRIWVHRHKKVTPKPKPKPTVTPPAPVVTPPPPTPAPQAPTCLVGQVMTASGCANQENHAEQHCLEQGGSWNSGTALCTIIQVNGNCSNIIVINGSGDTVNNYQEGNCKTEEKKTPTCAEADEVGTYPDCRPHTCEELGNCPPPKTCAEKGEVGAYPNCHKPTCEEEGNCPKPKTCAEKGEEGTYPNCEKPEPPKFIDVPEPNNLQADGETDPAFCTTVQMWGSDTGTLTEVSKYSGFGPFGENGVVTSTVSGLQKVCVTYAAPGEVPAGGYDEVTLTIKDNQHPSLKAERVIKIKIEPSPEEVRPS